jgi:hypothetical protein
MPASWILIQVRVLMTTTTITYDHDDGTTPCFSPIVFSCQIVAEKSIDVVAKWVTWKKWPKTAYKHELCICNWPDGVDESPGPYSTTRHSARGNSLSFCRDISRTKKRGLLPMSSRSSSAGIKVPLS